MLYKRKLKIHSRKFIHLSGKIIPELFRHDYIIQEKKEKVQIPSNLDVIPSSRGRENTFSSNRASSRYVYIRLRIMVGKKEEIKRSFLKEELFLPENTLAIAFHPLEINFSRLWARNVEEICLTWNRDSCSSFSNPSFNGSWEGGVCIKFLPRARKKEGEKNIGRSVCIH